MGPVGPGGEGVRREAATVCTAASLPSPVPLPLCSGPETTPPQEKPEAVRLRENTGRGKDPQGQPDGWLTLAPQTIWASVSPQEGLLT